MYTYQWRTTKKQIVVSIGHQKSSGKNTSVCSFDALFDLIKHGIESIVIKVESKRNTPWNHKHNYMYTYQWITTKKQIVVSISIFLNVLCFLSDYNVGMRIGTIGIMANTHHVLTVKAQTAKPLRQHIPIRVPSCLTDWVLYAMIIPVWG